MAERFNDDDGAQSETLLARRRFLTQSLAVAGLLTLEPALALSATPLLVTNVTQIYSVEVARIVVPRDAAEVAQAVQSWPGKVAVGGGRYSMGGQVAIRGGLHIDMRGMNRLVWIQPEEKRVRVQAGMRWRDLQDVLDPLGLAVKTMQSYSNFTVGGAVSVNAHGRYVGHGPVGHTVLALQMVLADGRRVEASPQENAALFAAAIGGYGACGVITEVELTVTRNVRIERSVATVALDRYVDYFERSVLGKPGAVLHNADLLPPAFNAPVCVTWKETDKALTEHARLIPRGKSYNLEKDVIWSVTELPGGERFYKSVIHPLLTRPAAVKWLNHEASLDVAQLEPRSRSHATFALQEYFVPKHRFVDFARAMASILQQHQVEAMNISIRHSPPDAVALLPWAKTEVFAFVLYYKQRVNEAAREAVGVWTRALIDQVLAHEGRYYLPYQPHASVAQFRAAYPEAERLRALKAEVDPSGKMSNELWAKYLS